MAKKKRAKAKHYPEIKPFRLLDLPAEIWSKIGYMVIKATPSLTGDPFAKVARPPKVTRKFRPRDSKIRAPPKVITCNLSVPLATQQPPITRVCRVLREELLSDYYNTKICLSSGVFDDTSNDIGRWLRAIGPTNRRSIQRIDLSLGWRFGVVLGSRHAERGLGNALKEQWKIDLRVELDPWIGMLGARKGVIKLL